MKTGNWYTSLTLAAALITNTGCKNSAEEQAEIQRLSKVVSTRAKAIIGNENVAKNIKIIRYVNGQYWEVILCEKNGKYTGIQARVWNKNDEDETWGTRSRDSDGDGRADDCGLENGGNEKIEGDITPTLNNLKYQKTLVTALEILENNQGQ